MTILLEVLRGLIRAPPAVVRMIAGGRIEIDGQHLDSQTQALLRVATLARRQSIHELSPKRARQLQARMRRLRPERPAGVLVHDERARLDGLEVPVRIYRPRTKATMPALVFFHGGGWVLGGLDSQDHLCADLARRLSCVVISGDYRLAPEHEFPAAVDDALAVFRWTRHQAEQLHIDAARIAVAGSSAGGNLAAVVAHQLRGEPGRPCLQLLLCPVTDISTESSSYDLFADGFLLSRAMMRWFIRHYAPIEQMRGDERASPLRAADLSGLPPTCVVVAGFDPLRDEGLAYAERLIGAGVAVELVLEPTTIHGFVPEKRLLSVGQRAFDRCVHFVARLWD